MSEFRKAAASLGLSVLLAACSGGGTKDTPQIQGGVSSRTFTEPSTQTTEGPPIPQKPLCQQAQELGKDVPIAILPGFTFFLEQGFEVRADVDGRWQFQTPLTTLTGFEVQDGVDISQTAQGYQFRQTEPTGRVAVFGFNKCFYLVEGISSNQQNATPLVKITAFPS